MAAGVASRLLLVAPTPREAAAVRTSTVCGAGPRATEAVDAMLRVAPRDLVVIAGVCGGLDPSLAPGSLILCRRAVNEHGDERIPERALFEQARRAFRARRLPFVSSSLLTVDAPVVSRAQKTALWNRHGAAGVDMETWGVIEAAAAHGVPWLAVRVVLDPASAALPPSLHTWSGEPDADVLRRVLRRPFEWPSYARLALQARSALRTLAAVSPQLSALSYRLEEPINLSAVTAR